MTTFSTVELDRALIEISTLMDENKQRLIDIDSVIGDADLGLTMSKGFAAAKECALELNDDDLGTRMKKIGFALAKAAPSTMGTLMATAFIGAGKVLADKQEFDKNDIALMFRSMAESVQNRGKAKEGEKTLLDVLFPVARALEAYDGDIQGGMRTALQVARESLDATKELMSHHGKAAVFREKTLGLEDPGAAAATLLIEGFARACNASF